MDLGCPLLRGSSDRRLPLLLERTCPGSIFSSVFEAVTVAMKIDSSGLVIWIKGINVSRCVRRLPVVEGAYVQWTHRYWGWFWRLRRLRTIIVIICILSIVCDRHCRQGIERIGRQFQVVQAWGNNWKLPSKTIWYRWLVRIVINCKDIGLRDASVENDGILAAWCSDSSVEFNLSGQLFRCGLGSDICST